MPRVRAWDRLIAETGTLGVHWEDHPEMQGLAVIAAQSPWLRGRASWMRTR